MRRIFSTACLFIMLFSLNINAQKNVVCHPGFTYTISHSSNWGNNLPVITGVSPYTSAETSGLKYADIIETINGVPTANLSTEEINQMLNLSGDKETVLTVKSIANPSRQVFLKRDCKHLLSVTESQLASVFAMYGLDFTNSRLFTCPFKTTTSPDVDFSQYKTFAFSISEEGSEQIETVLNEYIGKELTQKGLSHTNNNPDLLIQTFYYFDKNSNYKGLNKVSTETPTVYRYNATNGKMEDFPFLKASASEAEAEYLMQLGFRLIDQKNPSQTEPLVIWECESNERLTEPYSLESYARSFIPLMCMQYPFVTTNENVRFKAKYKTYNYTGISFNKDSLSQIIEVNKNSPAHAAGILASDQVKKIGTHDAMIPMDEIIEGYKSFVLASLKYRDPKTQFTNAAGIKTCMFWEKNDYPKIADMIQKEKYHAIFSYLYNFAPYINPTGSNTCDFEILRKGETVKVLIRPTIRTEFTLSID